LPSEAVVGGQIAGRTIVKVTDQKEMRMKSLCKTTLRQIWQGLHQLVLIE
jgi:hypothetical protein